MALVVTARSAPVVLADSRLATIFRRLAWLTAGWAFLAYVGGSVARAWQSAALAQDALSGVWLVLAALTSACAVLAWLVHRRTPGLLLAATLAPLLVATRLVASAVLVAVDEPTLADLAEGGLGLLVMGTLTWLVVATLPEPRRGPPVSMAGRGLLPARRRSHGWRGLRRVVFRYRRSGARRQLGVPGLS